MKFELVCGFCKKTYTVHTSPSKARKRLYCSKQCTNEDYKLRFAGDKNPAYGKVYRTKESHPDWAAAISKGSIAAGVNVGEKNAMKRPDVAARMSRTRRDRVTSDPAYREAVRKRALQNWADGKYDSAKTGKCKWYLHTKPDGSTCKLQGTWEVVYARYLDSQNTEYEAHKGRISYVDDSGIQRSYYPDFYLPTTMSYHDVKGEFWDDTQRVKIDLIKRSNPDMKLSLINKSVFTSFGIDINKESARLIKLELLTTCTSEDKV